jgi:hypothetical protein
LRSKQTLPVPTTGLNVPSTANLHPLIANRAKGLKLVSILVLGRLLRDLLVPVNGTMGRRAYAGTVIGLMLFVMARPEMQVKRAALSALAGGLAAAVLIAW